MSESIPVRPTFSEINLDNLSYNFNRIREHVNNKKIMGIIKADGYGHGAVEIAEELLNQGVDYLGVAILDEAVELRKAGIAAPILILGYTPVEHVDVCLKYGITPTIYTYEMAEALSQTARKMGKTAFVHVKIDTGMGRIGIAPENSAEFVKNISKLPSLEVEGVFTHFSVADEEDKTYTQQQINSFEKALKMLEDEGIEIPLKHAANSPATIDLPDAYFDMVRVGLALFGLYPSPHMKEKISLKPVMSLKTQVSHVKQVPKGTSISYGRKFITEDESIIGTLPVGYADGFTRLLSNIGEVIVNGKRVPIVGAICMDQCMFLGDDVPEIGIGDEVVIIGEQDGTQITVEDIADKLGTINYEIVTMVDKRVPRLYLKNGKLIKKKSLNSKMY
ncbi:alanine racemase [Natranaerobius thermophilus]|uniref:Alanine racemase n=1 Tax=Natranaerobius thermophilus (strain ATCC BAA-1301 / DSM 18059 / JW/NM-WN-LF) TaxID=457570 RepID=B2A571_NATTJ|nr:alanine racemase [Natranaerobius thermophilus]ACB83905.1 alanine racemase [Natranaerobius thermophilus JW/NM-WN-LF]